MRRDDDGTMKEGAETIRTGRLPYQPETPASAYVAASRSPSLALQIGVGRRIPVNVQCLLLCILMLTTACDQSSVMQPTTKPVAAVPVERIAQRGPVKLTVNLDRTAATVPEQLTLSLLLEAEIGVETALPVIGRTLGDFAVIEASDEPISVDGVYRRQERIVTLESVIPGQCSIPPIEVTFADNRPKADGSEAVYEDKAATEPIAVTVQPGLADAKGPLSLPLAWRYRLLLWAVGVLTAMVLIALAVRWWQRRREAKPEPPWARCMVLQDWALSELDKLIAEDLVGRGLVQEFYYRVNGLLRRYIELRFGLMAGEQTSEEFIRDLHLSARFDQRHRELLRQFVAACDPVKYARYQPQPDEIDWVYTTARVFVTETSAEPLTGPRAFAPSEVNIARNRAAARTEVLGFPGDDAEGQP